MSAPFAAIEAASVTHALAALSNATVTIAGVAVPVIFGNGYRGSFDGLINDSEPAIETATAYVSSVTVGTSLTINGAAYAVTAIQDDETGWTRLVLK